MELGDVGAEKKGEASSEVLKAFSVSGMALENYLFPSAASAKPPKIAGTAPTFVHLSAQPRPAYRAHSLILSCF